MGTPVRMRLSFFGAKSAGSAGTDGEGGLGFGAADGEGQPLVELAPGGGTTSTPTAPTFGGSPRACAPAAQRRGTTRDRAEHRISIPELVDECLVRVTVSAGEDDTLSQIIGQLASGNGFSSTSSNEDQVNADVPPPAAPAGTPPPQLIRALGTVSVLTLSCVTSTALYQPAAGLLFGRSKVGYYATLAAIFAAGVAEAITAVWLLGSRGAKRRRFIFGRVVLCAGVVLLVAVLGIGGSRFIKA